MICFDFRKEAEKMKDTLRYRLICTNCDHRWNVRRSGIVDDGYRFEGKCPECNHPEIRVRKTRVRGD